MKLGICLAFYNFDCKTYFAMSMGNTIWPACERVFFEVYGQRTEKGRKILVDMALEAGCTHLVFLNSDIAWEPDSIVRLIGHDKDVISGWGSGRFHPFLTNLGERVDLEKKLFRLVPNPAERKGLERVSLYGEMQVIKREVFERVASPWFFGPDMFKESGMMTDDTYFCLKCAEAGVEIWVDWDVKAAHLAEGWITHGGMIRAFTACRVTKGAW